MGNNISEETIQKTLLELRDMGILDFFRTSVVQGVNFFSPSSQFYAGANSKTTGEVFDQLNWSLKEDPETIKKYPADMVSILLMVTTKPSIERLVLLGYWNVNEGTIWTTTLKGISKHQSYLNTEVQFPSYEDVERIKISQEIGN